MTSRKATGIAVCFSLLSFIVFVALCESHVRRHAVDDVKRHADIVANALWNYNTQSVSEYLALACLANGYEYLVVTDTGGGVFQEVMPETSRGLEDLLLSLRLIPRIRIVSGVSYEGEKIGEIEVVWRSRALYVEIVVLAGIILLLVIFLLYLRVARSRKILEEKVEERTSELTAANASLIQEMADRAAADQEKKRLEIRLQQAHKMEAIGTLAGGIAHDFNNLLFPIMGYTEMILSDLPVDSPLRDKLRAILSASRRARDLVNQILTLARQTQEESRPVNCHRIVRDVVKLLRATIPATIEIRQNLCGHGGVILADPTRVHQVALNLCTNAFHAMRERGGVLEITLDERDLGSVDVPPGTTLTAGRWVLLSVRDTGSGMDRRVLERIFEPYFTTKEVGEGTGMGLSVVHGIVTKYGGDLQVKSEPGWGTVFDVYFPAMKGGEALEEAAGEEICEGVGHLLLVDDEPLILDMMAEMLEAAGYRVSQETSGVRALETFRDHPGLFDAVITDMTMPHMTGDVLAKRIMEIRPDVPIILCTGFSEKINGEKARQMGIAAFLLKPVVMKKLGGILHELLGKGAGDRRAEADSSLAGGGGPA
ncbi:MAG: ATP-binding protein [Pseudomonadota bacterium]